MSAVFSYGIANGLCGEDPAAAVKSSLLPVIRDRQPAMLELEEVRHVLRRAEEVPGRAVTRLALRLLALTAVRPGEVRGAIASEFEGLDTDEPVWRIPKERMKMRLEHVVPLSRQAADVVRLSLRVAGRRPMLYPNVRHPDRPMTDNTLGELLSRAGFAGRHVPHGFRASFSTIMNEQRPEQRAVIDMMLAHVPKNRVEAAYNRSTLMAARRQLAQEWADLLLEGAHSADSLLLGQRR